MFSTCSARSQDGTSSWRRECRAGERFPSLISIFIKNKKVATVWCIPIARSEMHFVNTIDVIEKCPIHQAWCSLQLQKKHTTNQWFTLGPSTRCATSAFSYVRCSGALQRGHFRKRRGRSLQPFLYWDMIIFVVFLWQWQIYGHMGAIFVLYCTSRPRTSCSWDTNFT